MSYILEALKRSQQERELGQVPTLAGVGLPEPPPPASANRWIYAALGLALVAVALALYAALATRGRPPETPRPVPASRQQPGPQATAAPPPTTPVPDHGDRQPPEAADHGLPITPSPAGQQPVRFPLADVPAADGEPAEIELDLSEVEVAEEPPAPDLPTVPAPSIPPDLLGEVERFKQRLEQAPDGPALFPAEALAAKKAGLQRSAAGAAPAPEPPRQGPATGTAAGDRPGNEFTLPTEVQQRLPPLRLTVHVYAASPDARFAIVNSEKLHQGGRTVDNLVLEEVRPDGVILSFEGHRFFKAR